MGRILLSILESNRHLLKGFQDFNDQDSLSVFFATENSINT